jgi:sulfonate transport system substrate-binding protein
LTRFFRGRDGTAHGILPASSISRRGVVFLACGALAATSRRVTAATRLWPVVVPPETALTVGDQNQVLQTLMAASGEQAKLGAKITYANFLGGPAVLEAFRSGALDLATVGDTPPIQAQAAGERIPIVAARRLSGLDYGLAVRPGLKLTRLAELRGKRIGYAEGTARQPFVLNLLKLAGLKRSDVTFVPLRSADFPDAIRSGAIDVGPLNEPHFSRYMADYADRGASAIPASEFAQVPHGLNYLYAADAALRDPAKTAAIADFVAHWMAAQRWSKANSEAWVDAYYVKAQNLSAADGRKIEETAGAITFPLLRNLVETQQSTADLIFDAGDLPKRLDARAEFDFRFDDVIAANAAPLAR